MDEIETQPFLEHPEKGASKRESTSPRFIFWTLLPSAISITLFFALLFVLLRDQPAVGARTGYGSGFVTDFAPITPSIKIEQRRFTGSIEFNEITGEPYLSENSAFQVFVGQPRPEIDAAWHSVLDGYHIYATPAEQATIDDGDFDGTKKSWHQESNGLYQDGIAMFHTLHCVNMIRMYIDYEYYKDIFEKKEMLDMRVHIEHCLDYIRQSIMCCGDLTPVPVRWHNASKHSRVYSDTGLTHTCRAFAPIRELVTGRHNGSKAVFIEETNDF
ncbi:hypothetical protein BGZ63DRAFT_442626 [Mariannaea sp. PMI_226]|nr:hypothetical protein BGZ63DRAFT_442626 [Mariannaea sp. PMI_226]